MQLFNKNIKVESSSGKSTQAHIFLGRESKLGIRVVLKQYIGQKKKSIIAEIKTFTLLENLRQELAGKDLNMQVGQGSQLEGLPQLLGYKASKQYSEIFMTHGGDSLEVWKRYIKSPYKRSHFAADMLRQIIISL